MGLPRMGIMGTVGVWLARRKFPTLLLFAGALLVIDLVLPDPIPLADELFLAVVTTILASWKKRRPVERWDPTMPPRKKVRNEAR